MGEVTAAETGGIWSHGFRGQETEGWMPMLCLLTPFLSSLVAQATGRSYPYLWWFSFLNNTAFTDTPLQVCFRGDSKPHQVDSKDVTVKRASQIASRPFG